MRNPCREAPGSGIPPARKSQVGSGMPKITRPTGDQIRCGMHPGRGRCGKIRSGGHRYHRGSEARVKHLNQGRGGVGTHGGKLRRRSQPGLSRRGFGMLGGHIRGKTSGSGTTLNPRMPGSGVPVGRVCRVGGRREGGGSRRGGSHGGGRLWENSLSGKAWRSGGGRGM